MFHFPHGKQQLFRPVRHSGVPNASIANRQGPVGLGLCPKSPVQHTGLSPHCSQGDSCGSGLPEDGNTASVRGEGIRAGIAIARDSIRTVVQDRHLLEFSFLAGFVILLLIAAEAGYIANLENILVFINLLPHSDVLYMCDILVFLFQAVCFFWFTIILAALVRYRAGRSPEGSVSIRDAFFLIRPCRISLAGLSLAMAVTGTVLHKVVTETQVFGKMLGGISDAMFFLPYAYYVPNVLGAALWFSAIILAIILIQFVLALYAIPAIVLGRTALIPAITGSVSLMKRSWKVLMGCSLVFGGIILAVAAIGLVIGQSPLLLNHDYDFFLQMSRGQVIMTAACYGFIAACGILTATGFSVLGVAITDLYLVTTAGLYPPDRRHAVSRADGMQGRAATDKKQDTAGRQDTIRRIAHPNDPVPEYCC